MEKELGRRNLLGRAGLALGGLVTLGALQACGGDSDDPAPVVDPPVDPPVDPQPLKVSQFPYAQHLPADFRLDVAAVKEAAYQAYWNGGCCHGAYSALLGDLARAGDPFDKLPLDFGKFGGGGVAGYGSICGAILGATLVTNMVVPADLPNAAGVRNKMITEQMRWYEGFAFPAYTPASVHANEAGKTLDFSAGNLANLQRKPRSHLCHASVTTWCAAHGVTANGKDKLSRCARLTADVAGKVAEMLNAFLDGQAFSGAPLDAASASCLTCHGPTATARPPVASGMACSTCHPNPSHPF